MGRNGGDRRKGTQRVGGKEMAKVVEERGCHTSDEDSHFVRPILLEPDEDGSVRGERQRGLSLLKLSQLLINEFCSFCRSIAGLCRQLLKRTAIPTTPSAFSVGRTEVPCPVKTPPPPFWCLPSRRQPRLPSFQDFNNISSSHLITLEMRTICGRFLDPAHPSPHP